MLEAMKPENLKTQYDMGRLLALDLGLGERLR